MPDFNNKGYGFLPVIAISALIITGSYFGYSWYMSNDSGGSVKLNNTEVTLNNNEESNNEDADVLQAASRGKVNTFSNPNNIPVYFGYSDETDRYNPTYFYYIYSKDSKKIDEFISATKDEKFITRHTGKKPCWGPYNSHKSLTEQYDRKYERISGNLLLITIKPKWYDDKENTRRCGGWTTISGGTTNFPKNVLHGDNLKLDLITLMNNDRMQSTSTGPGASVNTVKQITPQDVKLNLNNMKKGIDPSRSND